MFEAAGVYAQSFFERGAVDAVKAMLKGAERDTAAAAGSETEVAARKKEFALAILRSAVDGKGDGSAGDGNI